MDTLETTELAATGEAAPSHRPAVERGQLRRTDGETRPIGTARTAGAQPPVSLNGLTDEVWSEIVDPTPAAIVSLRRRRLNPTVHAVLTTIDAVESPEANFTLVVDERILRWARWLYGPSSLIHALRLHVSVPNAKDTIPFLDALRTTWDNVISPRTELLNLTLSLHGDSGDSPLSRDELTLLAVLPNFALTNSLAFTIGDGESETTCALIREEIARRGNFERHLRILHLLQTER